MSCYRKLLSAVAAAPILMVMAGAAMAQSQPIPPEHYTLDPRGVDLVSGTFNHSTTEVVIGQPGAGGMSYGRVYTENGWRDTTVGSMSDGGGGDLVVSAGPISEAFIGGAPSNGSTITYSAPNYIVTDRNGVVALFDTNLTNLYHNVYGADRGLITSITEPDGSVTTYHWKTVSGAHPTIYAEVRLQSVTNNHGYMLKYEYYSNTGGSSTWSTPKTITGINMAVDWCDPDADSCPTFSQVWPSVTYNSSTSNQATTATDQSTPPRVTTYSYTGLQLASVQFPASTSPDIAVTYAGSGEVSDVIDASGHWTYGFSTVGTTQTTTVAGPLSQGLTVLTDTTLGRATSVTDALSHTWTYQYDGLLRVVRITQPEGDYVDYGYDGRGNLGATTWTPKPGSSLSPLITYRFYPLSCTAAGITPRTCNKPEATRDGMGNDTQYAWNGTTGQLESVTLPAPVSGVYRPQTRFTYGSYQALYHDTASTYAAGSAISLPTGTSACATGGWNLAATPPACTTGAANEVVTSVAYPGTGSPNNLLPTSSSRGSGTTPAMATTAMTYTPDGDVSEVDGPLSGSGDKVQYFYDVARERTGAVGPDPDAGGLLLNRAQRITYNANGQVTVAQTGTTTGYIDPSVSGFTALLQSVTTYDPADFNRAVRAEQRDGGTNVSSVQQVEYDAAGRPSCTTVRMNPATWASLPAACTITSPDGGFGPDRISNLTYDVLGRPVTATSGYLTADALTGAAAYTANGKTASLTDGRNNVSLLEYDGFDRVVKLRYPNATGGGTSTSDFEAWTWNADGQVVTFQNRAAQTTTFTYDLTSRNTGVTAPSGTLSTTTTFDNLSRQTSVVGNALTVATTWDALSRVTAQSLTSLGSMSYAYDAAGRTISITWPDGFAATYDHDLYGAKTEIKQVPSGGGATSLATYTYDDLGMLTGIGRANGASSTYGHDAFVRLTSLVQNPTGSTNDLTFGYSYNPAGQIVGRTVSKDAYVSTPAYGDNYGRNGLNQVTSVNVATATYDGNGNATAITGNTYGYDAAGRLTSASAGLGSTAFVFDPLGRLHDSTVGGVRTDYVYAGQQLAAEYDSSGVMTHRYVPGLGLDDVVTAYVGSGTGTRSWHLSDERGSVVALTDGSGAATQLNAYDEYGTPAPGNAGRFQYAGQPRMAEAGAYNYRARAYLPQIGRFLQTDPMGYAAGQNVYAYVGLNPINFTDAMGLVPAVVCYTAEYGGRDVTGEVSGIGPPCHIVKIAFTTMTNINIGFGDPGSSLGSFPGDFYGPGGGGGFQISDDNKCMLRTTGSVVSEFASYLNLYSLELMAGGSLLEAEPGPGTVSGTAMLVAGRGGYQTGTETAFIGAGLSWFGGDPRAGIANTIVAMVPLGTSFPRAIKDAYKEIITSAVGMVLPEPESLSCSPL